MDGELGKRQNSLGSSTSAFFFLFLQVQQFAPPSVFPLGLL